MLERPRFRCNDEPPFLAFSDKSEPTEPSEPTDKPTDGDLKTARMSNSDNPIQKHEVNDLLVKTFPEHAEFGDFLNKRA